MFGVRISVSSLKFCDLSPTPPPHPNDLQRICDISYEANFTITPASLIIGNGPATGTKRVLRNLNPG